MTTRAETGNNALIKQTNIDFEAIYTNIIKKAVESDDLDLVPTRSGDVKELGMIYREMIGHIIDADVVIVDITLENPKRLLQLGIRHSLRRSTTVVIRHARHQPRLSFNIAGMRAIEYDDQKLDQSVAKLRDTIKAASPARRSTAWCTHSSTTSYHAQRAADHGKSSW